MTNESPKLNEVALEPIEDIGTLDHQMETTNLEEEGVPHVHAKTYWTVAAVTLVYFAQLVNLVGSGAFRSAIAASLGDSGKTTWILATTVIFNCYLGPPISQAADYWGRKWFLLIPTFCGVIGSIVIATAPTMNAAIAGEAICGISYGAQPLLHTIASEVLTHRNRGAAQAAVNFGNGMGGIAALLLGGVMTEGNPSGFRNFWYMTAGIYALAAIVAYFVYNPSVRPTQVNFTFKEKIRRLDWVGYALLGPGLVLWILGLEWAQNPYSWKDGHVLGPVLVGATFIITFIIYEWKFKSDGLLHHGLFARDRNFALALFCVCVEGLVFFTANSFLSYQVGLLYDTSSIRVSLRYCVAFLMFMLTAWGLAFYSYNTKRIRLPIMLAFACFSAFNICMSTTQLGSNKAVWGYPVILGCGLGVSLTALVTAAQLSAPPELIALTSGLMVSLRAFGGTIGLGVYTAIYRSKLTSGVQDKVTSAVLPFDLPSASLATLIQQLLAGVTTGLENIPGMTDQIVQASRQAYLLAFVDAVRGVWITAACFAAAAIFASFFMFDPIEQFNMHIDAPAETMEDLYGK